ncbi:MAG TPA: ArgR family transcriptional regulator [Legionella sp.]|nr:ArgR family transcriptional regulator [Legionella sp.]
MVTEKMTTQPPNTLVNDLKNILLQGIVATQETICSALEAKGHPMNQSKVSRLLRNINAIKSKNDKGEMVYRLPHDIAPPSISTALAELIIDVVMNENMIIIKTSPGSASLVARIIDDKRCQVIGTIAGDDTIFAAPESVEKIATTFSLICTFLGVR